MGWINPSGALRLLHILWQILGKTSEYLFAAVFSTKIHSHHQLNLCYPEYSCEHAPVLERAVGCFPLIWSMLLRTSKKKTCAHFRHLCLVKVKVTLQSFLLHLLRCFYFLYLAFFLNNGVHNNCIIIFKFK